MSATGHLYWLYVVDNLIFFSLFKHELTDADTWKIKDVKQLMFVYNLTETVE